MKQETQLESTLDGSHTLYVPALDEHYHSVNGAKQESVHVFINAGLSQSHKQKLSILEVGFGTGLNTYLTYQFAQTPKLIIDYTALELYPLDMGTINQLNYVDGDNSADQVLFWKLHECEWNKKCQLTTDFSLNNITVRNLYQFQKSCTFKSYLKKDVL